jgi:predicted peptidase
LVSLPAGDGEKPKNEANIQIRSTSFEMKIFRKLVAIALAWTLELSLALSTLLLIGELCWPTLSHWWRLPSPGQIGFDSFEAETMAHEFVIQLPPAYSNGDRWPLIVFLHGSGERRNDVTIRHGQDVLRQRLPAIVAAPTCLPSCGWAPDAVAKLIQCIALGYHVDRNRIYLVGYSMGGYGAWETAAAHPELFAAIVPISGGGDPDKAKQQTRLAIWAFHGENDKAVAVEESQRMIQAVRRAGGEPRLTILPKEGHGICGAVCDRTDLWEWLFQQRRRQ